MNESNKLTDILVIILSLIVIVGSFVWLMSTGAFNFSLAEDQKLTWHLVRSSGIVAYVLLMISTVWGLLMSSQFVKDWSPGPVSLTLHSTVSWLSVLFALSHALLLLLDDYFAYTIGDLFIPFTGPYRPEFVGLGTIAFWLLLIISISFPLQKRLGNRNWKFLHYTSYLAFALVSIHGLFAGTDGSALGFRLLTGIGVLVVVLLLGIRVGKDQAKVAPARRTRQA